jgi:hypothetical protein
MIRLVQYDVAVGPRLSFIGTTGPEAAVGHGDEYPRMHFS